MCGPLTIGWLPPATNAFTLMPGNNLDDHLRDGYEQLNPNRKMPVLEDEGFVLWESNAILQYLAAKRPESGLWPSDARRRSR